MEDIETTYKNRISQDPAVIVGKPVVKGIRIPVELVLGHLAHNPDLNDLFGAYPHLILEDVKAFWPTPRPPSQLVAVLRQVQRRREYEILAGRKC